MQTALFHLSGRKRCERMLRKAEVWKGKTMTIRWLPGIPKTPGQPLPPAGVYLGTFAPATLSKKAVERNRMRRRCREAIRVYLQGDTELSSVQLLICPRSSSLHCTFAEISADVTQFFSSLASWLKPAAMPNPSSAS